MKSYSRQEQKENIEKVKGTEVQVLNEKTGKWSHKTAKVVDYWVPLVWELDRPIYGTEFHYCTNVRTVAEGKQLADLI